jgi:uncharacterized protein YcfJ
VASAFAIAPAFAQWDGPYQNRYSYSERGDYARVIDSTPVYASAREECWNPRTGAFEERRDRHSGIGAGGRRRRALRAVFHRQPDRSGRRLQVAGAILGGIIGHQIERQRDRDDDLDTSNCRSASYDSGVAGYDVRLPLCRQ